MKYIKDKIFIWKCMRDLTEVVISENCKDHKIIFIESGFLREPIKAFIVRDPVFFIVFIPGLFIFGEGITEEEAMADIRNEIEDLYLWLLSVPQNKLNRQLLKIRSKFEGGLSTKTCKFERRKK